MSNNNKWSSYIPSQSRPNIQEDGGTTTATSFINSSTSHHQNENNQNSNEKFIYHNPKPTIQDLHKMEKEDALHRKPNIEDEANIFSNLSFTWFTKLMNDACEAKLPRGEVLPTSIENCTTRLACQVEDQLFFTELEREKTWDDFFASTNGGAIPPVHPYVGVKKQEKNPKTGNIVTRHGVMLWIGKLLQDEPDHSVSKFSLGPSKMRAAVQWFDDGEDNRKSTNSESSPLIVNVDEEYLHSPTPPPLTVTVNDSGQVNGEDLVGMLPPLQRKQGEQQQQSSSPLITCVAVEDLEIDFSFNPPEKQSKMCSKKEREDIYKRRQSSAGDIGGDKDDPKSSNNNNNNNSSSNNYPVPSRASIFWSIARPHANDFIFKVAPLRLLAEAANLSSPYLLELYVDYLHKDPAKHPDLWKEGVIIASALAVVYFIFSITSQKWFQIAMRAGLKARSALMLTILHKALCLAPQAQSHPALSVGKCVTMFGTDVTKIGDAFGYIIYIVSMPVQISVTIFLMYRLMGWVAFVSLGVTFLFIPLSAYFMKLNGQARAKMSTATDARAKLTTELFSSFKVIKCMGWEENFLTRMLEVRDTELDFLGEMQKYRVSTSFLMNAAPAAVLAVSLITFHLDGNVLTPVVIFPVISLLGILRMFSMILPWIFQIIVDVNVSLGRMRVFLSANDLAPFISLMEEGEANKKEKHNDNDNNDHHHHHKNSKLQDGIVVSNLNITCFEGKDITKEIKKDYGRKLKLWNLEQRQNRCCCSATTCCCFGKPGDGAFLNDGVFTDSDDEEEDEKENENENSSGKKNNNTTTSNNNNNDKNNKKETKEDESNEVKKRIANASKKIEALVQKRILSDISVRIPQNGLTMITGVTGAGKTVLMESLLSFNHATFSKTGTAPSTPLITYFTKNNNNDNNNSSASNSGSLTAPSIAFIPQTPWLMNGTIKEQIVFFSKTDNKNQPIRTQQEEEELFDSEFIVDETRLQDAINCCQLRPDLETFDKGLETVVGSSSGASGVSGGQRARIALARLVYAKADINFLDDPLSALDAHVGESVFRQCILGALKNKTRILVTHHLHYLHYANHIIHLENGQVAFQGDYAEYTQFVTSKKQAAMEKRDTTDGMTSMMMTSQLSATMTPLTKMTTQGTHQKPQFPDSSSAAASTSEQHQQQQVENTDDENKNKNNADDDDKTKDQDMNSTSTKTKIQNKQDQKKANESAEGIQEGDVKKETWLSYFHAAGGISRFIFIIGWFLFTECVNQSQVIWLTFWSGDLFHFENQSTYLYIYIGLVLGGFFSSASRTWFILESGRTASRYLHFKILSAMIIAKVQFFDTRPLGMVINRFSSDMDTIDMQFPMDAQALLSIVFSLAATLIIMVSSQPIAIAPLVIVWYLYIKVMKFFNASVREIKRIDSVNKSPIFALVTEFMEGTKTILAFNKAAPLLRRASRRIDAYFSTSYCLQLVNRWLGVRLELLGNATIASIAFAGVITKSFPGHTSAFGGREDALVGLIALGLTLSMQIVGLMNYLVRMSAALNADCNAVERVDQYSNEVEIESQILKRKMIPKHYLSTYDELVSERVDLQNEVQLKIREKVEELKKENPEQFEQDKKNAVEPQVVTDCEEYNSKIEKFYKQEEGRRNNQQHGCSIVFQGLSMRYRPELPLVIKNISVSLPAGCKAALVGRSGAAKSSLLNIAMGLTEIASGRMLIDGKDSVKEMTLAELRENFALIPQDPTLFQGTYRSNLDPFNLASDEEIEKAIDMVGLTERVFYPASATSTGGNGEEKNIGDAGDDESSSSDNDNDDENKNKKSTQQQQQQFVVDDHASPTDFTPAEKEGDNENESTSKPSSPTSQQQQRQRLPLKEALNQAVTANTLSAGQKQLLCLSRALLRKSARCILLDEYSSSIDQASDELITQTVRKAFADKTCIFVAHRLTTIAHVDKVIVMDKGRIVEVGSPKELMKKTEDGKFYSLVASSGKKGMKQFERALAKYGSKV